jgi:hypothetical protein
MSLVLWFLDLSHILLQDQLQTMDYYNNNVLKRKKVWLDCVLLNIQQAASIMTLRNQMESVYLICWKLFMKMAQTDKLRILKIQLNLLVIQAASVVIAWVVIIVTRNNNQIWQTSKSVIKVLPHNWLIPMMLKSRTV